MGLKDYLQNRKNDSELGQGVWRRVHDRFIRGIDRFHQILERMPNDAMVELMVPEANELADLIPRVRAIAVEAQRLAPSQGTDIPASPSGVFSDLHRTLSKSGNSVALCAEALAMVRCFGECNVQCAKKLTVSRRVQTVAEQVQAAEALLARAQLEAAA